MHARLSLLLAPLALSAPLLAQDPAGHLEALRGWAEGAGYTVEPDPSGALLLFQPAARTLRVDTRGRAAERRAVPLSRLAEGAGALWGEGDPVQEEPACLFVLRDGEDMVALNRLLAGLPGCEYLAGFAEHAGEHTSFLHQTPLVAGLLEDPDGVEEWSLAHEGTAFGARLLLLRRFGRVPLWLELGAGLRLQEEVLGDIYSYPYRNGFVGIGEHGGWAQPLSREWKGFARGRMEPVAIGQLAGYPRGRYDEQRIARTWGFWRFAAEHAGDGLAPLLARLGQEQREGARSEVHHPDGSYTFTIDPDFEVPPARQEQLLREHLGQDVLERLSLWYEVGPRDFEKAWKRYSER